MTKTNRLHRVAIQGANDSFAHAHSTNDVHGGHHHPAPEQKRPFRVQGRGSHVTLMSTRPDGTTMNESIGEPMSFQYHGLVRLCLSISHSMRRCVDVRAVKRRQTKHCVQCCARCPLTKSYAGRLSAIRIMAPRSDDSRGTCFFNKGADAQPATSTKFRLSRASHRLWCCCAAVTIDMTQRRATLVQYLPGECIRLQ